MLLLALLAWSMEDSILLISDSSFFLIPPPWHTTWSQERTGGSGWHIRGSCYKNRILRKCFKSNHVFNTDRMLLNSLDLPPHSWPQFPSSLSYLCFAWTPLSSSMWPRASTNNVGGILFSLRAPGQWIQQSGREADVSDSFTLNSLLVSSMSLQAC